ATHYIAAYHRNIIFEITSYDTGTTTRTGIEVDSHHPFMARLLVLIPQIISFVCIGPPTGIVRRVFLILRETRFADDVTTFDGMVCLRLRQLIGTTGFGQLRRGVVSHGAVLELH